MNHTLKERVSIKLSSLWTKLTVPQDENEYFLFVIHIIIFVRNFIVLQIRPFAGIRRDKRNEFNRIKEQYRYPRFRWNIQTKNYNMGPNTSDEASVK